MGTIGSASRCSYEEERADMVRSRAVALVLLLVPAAGWAQAADPGLSATSFDVSRLTAVPLPARKDPAVALRMIEKVEPSGSKTRHSGILIGEDVGPNMTLGLGLFSIKPRKSGLAPDPQLDSSARPSKKASVRLTIRF
jgi:hypothetical protein